MEFLIEFLILNQKSIVNIVSPPNYYSSDVIYPFAFVWRTKFGKKNEKSIDRWLRIKIAFKALP